MPQTPRETDEPISDWDTARHRAAMLRLDRTAPSIARRRAGRWLAAVTAVLWIVSVTAHLLARLDPDAHRALRLTGDGAALALVITGFTWFVTSGRIEFAERSVSPATPLTKADRRRIGRQLARSTPLDLEHADVVLELAHRRRRLALSAPAVIALELPNIVGSAIDHPDAPTLVLCSLDLLVLLGAGVYALVVSVRLGEPIRRLAEAAAALPPC